MGNKCNLIGRGFRYIKKHGARQLYCKIMERRLQNKLELPYSGWLESQKPGEAMLEEQRKHVFAYAPKISVLVPTYETPEEFLCQMVDSLRNQTYGNWELCIADGSKSDLVKNTLKAYMESDDRIRYRKLEKNLGISENTNGAYELATGEWIALLDHDDILHPNTLFEIVKGMEEEPEAEAFYTDEDKVSFDLKMHFQPHFKPDFNRELLRSNNYICHFFVVKRSVVEKVGLFSSDFDGAQDFDFILRCTEEAKKVKHIPKILYSWRCHASSTAANPESKLYAYEAGKRAVAAHLARCKEQAEVLDTSNYGFYRVKYQVPKKGKKDVVFGKFIDTFEKMRGQNDVNVVYYDKACNKIVTFAQEDGTDGYMLFTCVKNFKSVRTEAFLEEFLQELMSVCERPEVGMACARVYGKDGKLANDVRMAGVQDPFGRSTKGLGKGYLGYVHRACLQQEILEPTDCFLMKAEVFRKLTDGMAEVDITKLIEQGKNLGYRAVYDPWAVLYER